MIGRKDSRAFICPALFHAFLSNTKGPSASARPAFEEQSGYGSPWKPLRSLQEKGVLSNRDREREKQRQAISQSLIALLIFNVHALL